MSETQTIKDKDKISISLSEDDIEVRISYPKQSTLRRRKEIINKLQEFVEKY